MASRADAFGARWTTRPISRPSFSVAGLHWTQRSAERPEYKSHAASSYSLLRQLCFGIFPARFSVEGQGLTCARSAGA